MIQSKGIKLTRKGKQYAELCPFHGELESASSPAMRWKPHKTLITALMIINSPAGLGRP
ncbi:MAG: hypothetical protein L0387_38120 [Acidobacteria bacterium]|nr:hypothetical protein [Acidobacteriota bacterium]MCI0627403.1 hypothetical protein [Acidobacteriota bacterium]MCI0720322.1 hypothetical protein [Acidobacteriota bacterium]